MNWPNRLTLLRLILIPIIIVLLLIQYYDPNIGGTVSSGNYQLPIMYLVSGIIFIIASFTDFLDGYIARKYNLVSDFGKFFDPIADKMLVNATLILFSVLGILPVWITLILILRDIFVDFIRMILSRNGVTLAAGIFGKLKTVFQMIGLSILFFIGYQMFNPSSSLSNEYGWMNQLVLIPMYLAVFFSLYSGVDYFIKAKPNLFKTKS